MVRPLNAAEPEAKMPPEVVSVESERDPTFKVPEIVEEAPFTMRPPEMYLEVEVEFVVVALSDTRFKTVVDAPFKMAPPET